ncbi:MAG: hypothetical protein M3527_10310 [Actinomycetota bacterium]|nr:hypothetical protein [Acidimicrobiia bacterium]MDQ3294824.1 hypothetical protein [Actinomycetota bacterium]
MARTVNGRFRLVDETSIGGDFAEVEVFKAYDLDSDPLETVAVKLPRTRDVHLFSEK